MLIGIRHAIRDTLTGGYCFLRYAKGNSCYSRAIQAFDGKVLKWDDTNFYNRLFTGEDGKHMALEFHRRIGTELTFRLEASSQLETGWQNTGATVEVIGAIDGERERCRIIDPLVMTTTRRFIRVVVALP